MPPRTGSVRDERKKQVERKTVGVDGISRQ
jgi:hypothetical protein